MSLAAIAASISPTPSPAPEPARDAAGRGAAGSKFSSLLDTFAGGPTQGEAATDGAPESTGGVAVTPPTTADSTPIVRATTNLEAALAKLARDAASGASASASKALPTPSVQASAIADTLATAAKAGVATQGGVRGAARTPDPDDADSTAGANSSGSTLAAAANAAIPSLLYGALVQPVFAPAATATPATVSQGVARALQETISAGSGLKPANAGGQTGETGEAANATLRGLIGDDPSLVVTAAQTRTFLGLDGARATLAGAQALAGVASETSSNPQPAPKRAAAVVGAPAPAPKSDPAAPPPISAGGGGHSGAASDKPPGSSGDNSSPASASGSPAASVVNAGVVGPLTGSITLAQLPDAVAEAADELSAAADATDSAGGAAPSAQPVKELQLELQPAELGSVQLTMRLADGKLSVVVGVSKSSTLKAVEGERDAIVARLGAGGSTLDSFVVTQIKSTSASAADSPEGATSGSQDNASNRANGDAPSGGDTASRRNGASDAERRQRAAQLPPVRRSAGDLVV